jgi:hypothetical protein
MLFGSVFWEMIIYVASIRKRDLRDVYDVILYWSYVRICGLQRTFSKYLEKRIIHVVGVWRRIPWVSMRLPCFVVL